MDEIERLLRRSGLVWRYPQVTEGLRHGFRVGFPSVERTQIPPNKDSVGEYGLQFQRVVDEEIRKGRYLGPVSREVMEAAIGYFQCSPLSVIPKTTPGKIRIIQDFSFPHFFNTLYPLPSVNSHTDASAFPCTWGTFLSVAHLVWYLPPGSQMAVRDVAEAYRTIPLHSSQWAATVVGLGQGLFCADIFAAFGARPSGGVFGIVADALGDLMRWRGIGPFTKWVDDHVFFRIRRTYLASFNRMRDRWREVAQERGARQSGGRIWFEGEVDRDGVAAELFEDCEFPLLDLRRDGKGGGGDEGAYTYGMEDIDAFSAEVGIPWEKSKDQPFASVGQYVGLVWDLGSRTVALPEDKAAKYLAAVGAWQEKRTHSLHEVQQLYGRLLHAALVVPAGRSRLTGLESMLGLFNGRPFVSLHAPSSVLADLVWWADTLGAPGIYRDIGRMFPAQVVDCAAFSDASSGVGIGIIVSGRWRAWRLLPGWTTLDGSKDIQWAEAVGFELLVYAVLASKNPGTHFRLYGDNRGVVEGWWNRRSRNTAVNKVFCRLLDYLSINGFDECIHSTYVRSKDNPADGPSRGILPPASDLLPEIILPPSLQRFLIDATSPLTAQEEAVRRSGRAPAALPKDRRTHGRTGGADSREGRDECDTFREFCNHEDGYVGDGGEFC